MQKRNLLIGWTLAAAPILSSLSLSCALAAQGGTQGQTPPIVGGARFVEAWVDPYNGNDTLAAVGAADRPFQTLSAAINSVALRATILNPGLVHANPGIYSNQTNSEPLPVQMRDFVNVQAVDFKSCIIRGDGDPDGFTAFYPTNTGNCTCGSRAAQEILVDLTGLFDQEYVEKFDGFTLQGGNVQVYAETELGQINATVSNCLFDMLDGSDTNTTGPDFGVLMVHTWDFTNGGIYPDIPLNVLNNTFIQTQVDGQGTVTSALPDAVAIADTNEPLCGNPFGDPDQRLRGVGSPNVQNNLIRNNQVLAPNTFHMAMLGLDASDTATVFPAATNTNAFDPAAAGSITVGGTYCSLVLGPTPVPAANPNPTTGGADPLFVGEFLTSYVTIPVSMGRDWRLLPSSPMRNLGVAPALVPGGTLQAANGSTYVVGLDYPEWSFAFDGEGYGNLRVRDGVDLGCDQIGRFIVCGFGNDNRNINSPLFAGDQTPNGFGLVIHIYDQPGTYTAVRVETPVVATGFNAPVGPLGFFWAYSCQFGCLAPPISGTLPGVPTLDNLWWLDSSAGAPLVVPTPPVLALLMGAGSSSPYTSPADPAAGVQNVFVQFGTANATPGSYVNEQLFFTPLGAPHAFVPGAAFSNAQSYRF